MNFNGWIDISDGRRFRDGFREFEHESNKNFMLQYPFGHNNEARILLVSQKASGTYVKHIIESVNTDEELDDLFKKFIEL
jgi:hypothetical protein